MRPRAPGRIAALGCALTLVACGGTTASSSFAAGDSGAASPVSAVASSIPDGDWSQFGYEPGRSSFGPVDTGIAGRDVRSLGERIVRIDGTADSSAIALHAVRIGGKLRDVAVVTTSYGHTIAFDPGSGRRLWEFIAHGADSLAGSERITTSSPVADPNRRFVYAASPDGLIHKLRLSDGSEVRGHHWPVRITFDASREKLAAPLGVTPTALIAMTNGYFGDAPSYQGHIAEIDFASGRITHEFNTLCSNLRGLLDPPSRCPHSDSGLWGRAGAVIEPSGRILLATGNGDFDGRANWGDSVLELSSTLRLLHNWTPRNQQNLNDTDTDLGSTSPVLLGSFGGRTLVAQGGKSGEIALLDLGRLNGTQGGAGPRLGGQLGYVPTPGQAPLFSAPAVLHEGARTLMFVADGVATCAYEPVDPAHPRLRVDWTQQVAGTSPVLAGGLLYVYDPQGALNVYRPLDGHRIASLRVPAGHWNSPIVVGGRVILPVGDANTHSTSGEVIVLHLRGR